MNDTIPEPTIEPFYYKVSCLPKDHAKAHHVSLQVRYCGGGKWSVKNDGGCYMDRVGVFSRFEEDPDATFEEHDRSKAAWDAEHVFDLDTALSLAKKHAPVVLQEYVTAWGYRSVTELLERSA